jgi:hypothetical protein
VKRKAAAAAENFMVDNSKIEVEYNNARYRQDEQDVLGGQRSSTSGTWNENQRKQKILNPIAVEAMVESAWCSPITFVPPVAWGTSQFVSWGMDEHTVPRHLAVDQSECSSQANLRMLERSKLKKELQLEKCKDVNQPILPF